jgi:hypothetical protein
LLEQVGGDKSTVGGGRAQIIDRMDLGGQDRPGFLDRAAGRQKSLSLREPHDGWRHTAERDGGPWRAHGSHDHLGDGLCGAGPDLAEPLAPVNLGDFDRGDELV